MDKEQFLKKLFKKKNIVGPGKGGTHCMICYDEYGSISIENGKPERHVRLPCDKKHTVGSKCISKWFENHNTCPLCRYEFFPAEETDVEMEEDEEDEDGEEMGDEEMADWETADEEEVADDQLVDEDVPLLGGYTKDGCRWVDGVLHFPNCQCFPCFPEEETDEDEEEENIPPHLQNDVWAIYYRDLSFGLRKLKNLCQLLCDELGLTYQIEDVASIVAEQIWDTDSIQDASPFSNFSIAAACVYTAIHGLRRRQMRAIYQRRLARQLADVCLVSEESLHAAYRMIYEKQLEIWYPGGMVQQEDLPQAL